jgi:phospholipid/cholesterol/gamma-HCH transport system substrate-binding protein
MKEQKLSTIKLGAFVLIATTCLLLGLYYMGSKKNIFHSSISVSANFNNVGGLLAGNNVRFNGINVGTISKIYAISDTTIKVEFTIDEAIIQFISDKSIVSIGTDGLLGNKLLDISPSKEGSTKIKDGQTLNAMNPIQMDNAMRTLMVTNENLKVISANLKSVTEKFNNSNSLWHLLTDTVVAENVRNAIVSFKLTGNNSAILTGDLRSIVQDIKTGKGTIGSLITDTSLAVKLNQTIVNIKNISDTMAVVSGDFKSLSQNLKNGKGSIGALLTDTTFVHNLNQSMINIKDASGSFNQNMDALKVSWPFKKYFKNKKKTSSKP